MAVPKRKTSRSRTRSRKANWMRTPVPTGTECRECGRAIPHHAVCVDHPHANRPKLAAKR